MARECVDPRHALPCPQPCAACREECDPRYLRPAPDHDEHIIHNEHGEIIAYVRDRESAKLMAEAPRMLLAIKTALRSLEDMTSADFAKGADKPIRDNFTAILHGLEAWRG